MNSSSEEPIVLIEDGHTFLNREELDEYRTQKIQMEWAERKGSDG